MLATHGRSIWIADITALRGLSTDVLKTEQPVLLKPNTVTRYQTQPSMGGTNRRFAGENPKASVPFTYILPKSAQKAIIKIVEPLENKTLSEVKVPTIKGVHRQTWDLTAGNRGVAAFKPNPGERANGDDHAHDHQPQRGAQVVEVLRVHLG